MAALHGRGGMVYLQGSGAAAVKLGLARGWSIDVTREKSSSNVLGDSWVKNLSGLLAFKGKIDGLLDNADTTAFDSATQVSSGNAALRSFYFYPDATNTATYYYGQIWPEISITDSMKDVENYTMNFDGDGQLGKN